VRRACPGGVCCLLLWVPCCLSRCTTVSPSRDVLGAAHCMREGSSRSALPTNAKFEDDADGGLKDSSQYEDDRDGLSLEVGGRPNWAGVLAKVGDGPSRRARLRRSGRPVGTATAAFLVFRASVSGTPKATPPMTPSCRYIPYLLVPTQEPLHIK